jgi:cell division septation protein DedD
MASPVPKNVAAALGLVPTVLGGVRRLPAKAVQLPVLAVGTALNGLEAAKREYGELADRGEKLIARLRGTSFDELEDAVEDKLAGTPVAKLYDRAEDALEDAAETVGRTVKNLHGGSTANAKEAATSAAARVQDRVEADRVVQETLPVAEAAQPAGKLTAESAPTGGVTRVDSAATPEVIEQVERIAGNVAAPLITDHAELPLPDYDHMTLGSLRGRLRSLDMQQLVQLRDYEKSKADRLPVVTMLDNRIAKLANGESVPTGTVQDTPSPKASTPVKPPKKLGETAAAKNEPSPPRTKVRIT